MHLIFLSLAVRTQYIASILIAKLQKIFYILNISLQKWCKSRKNFVLQSAERSFFVIEYNLD